MSYFSLIPTCHQRAFTVITFRSCRLGIALKHITGNNVLSKQRHLRIALYGCYFCLDSSGDSKISKSSVN